MMKIEDLIPKGIYCYESGKWGPEIQCYTLQNVCPFLRSFPTRHEQERGYCLLDHHGDWNEQGFGLLWDQVKECGINEDWE